MIKAVDANNQLCKFHQVHPQQLIITTRVAE